jgi:uncharacterized delta-60 repeat protein
MYRAKRVTEVRPAFERLESRQLFTNVPGAPDPGWGTNGTATAALSGHTLSTPSAILPQGDNGVIVVGTTAPDGVGGATSIFLAKFNSDGSVQTHWGTSGFVFTTPPYTSLLYEGAGQSQDGAITVLVTVSATITQHKKLYEVGGAMLIHYNADGTLDRHFGHGGEMFINGLTQNQNALSVSADGAITVAGVYVAGPAKRLVPNRTNVFLAIAAQPPAPSQFELTRYTPSGHLDHTFGNGGITRKKVGISVGISSMVMSTNGDIAIAGSVYFGPPTTLFNTPFDSALLRFDVDGRADSLFGGNGIVIGSQNTVVPQIAFGDSNDLLVASVQSGDVQVVDYGPTGQLNLTFGDRGIAKIASAETNVVFDGLGGISFKNLEVTLFCQSVILTAPGADNSLTLVQVNPLDGSVITPFGTSGQTVIPRPSDVELFGTAFAENTNDLFFTQCVAGPGGTTLLGVSAYQNTVQLGVTFN